MLFFLFQFSRFFTFLSVNFALLKVLDTFFAEFNPFFSVLQALFACNYVVKNPENASLKNFLLLNMEINVFYISFAFLLRTVNSLHLSWMFLLLKLHF